MTKLLFVRHGQSEANLKRVFAGNYNPKLTDLGEKQAQATAKYIFENFKVDKVYSSTLDRAFKTGEYIARAFGHNVIKDKSFCEIYAGKWEGIPFDIIQKTYSEDYDVWVNDIGNATCTEGESVKDLAKRVIKSTERLAKKNDGKTIVIATHATPVRSIQCIFSGLELSLMKDIPWASNSSVTEVDYHDGEFKLVSVGYDGHLDDLKSTLPSNV